ncbi:MAG: hypothetical protein HDR82_09940 [Bacteroides sp.]|nr:hypothetical protein [Bacteroides sp.]
MKTKVTRSEIKSYFNTVINCDYMTGQEIESLCGLSPEYYNAGGCGWNWDAFDVDGVCMVYGYRGFPGNKWVQSTEGAKIVKYLRKLKTKRGRIAAAARLLTKYAGL